MRVDPSVTEVARNFAGYIDRAASRGEGFIPARCPNGLRPSTQAHGLAMLTRDLRAFERVPGLAAQCWA